MLTVKGTIEIEEISFCLSHWSSWRNTALIIQWLLVRFLLIYRMTLTINKAYINITAIENTQNIKILIKIRQVCRSRFINHSIAPSSSRFRPSKPSLNFLIGQSYAICFMVWSGAPQSYSIDSAKFHRYRKWWLKQTHAFLGRLWFTLLLFPIAFHSSPGRNGKLMWISRGQLFRSVVSARYFVAFPTL